MSQEQRDPLRDYISGAKKLGGDEQFKQDMLERIASHDTQTVSGMKHITRKQSNWFRSIAVIAAAFCCIIGISVFAIHYLRDAFDPHGPVESQGDYGSTDWVSAGADDSVVDYPNADAYEPLLKQLLQAEQEITSLECRLADMKTEDEINALNGSMQQWQLQKEMILQELCMVMRHNAGDILLAYAGYDSSKQRLRLTVINGGNREITIPAYCTISDADGIVASGYLMTESEWNLHTLPTAAWATLYCDLKYAAVPDADAEKWQLAEGSYTVHLGDALFAQNADYATTLEIQKKASMTCAKGSFLHDFAERMAEHYNGRLNHADLQGLAAQAAEYRQENYVNLATYCKQIMSEIMCYNGNPDYEASGIPLSVYHIGESGNAAVIEEFGCRYYVYYDALKGEVHIGTLLDIGTFGEL